MPSGGCAGGSVVGWVVCSPRVRRGFSRSSPRPLPGPLEVGMSGSRRVAYLVCGRRAKWLVLVLWLGLLVVFGPFAQKLTDAQDNDAASWLPGSAESTQVLHLSEDFRPEQIPAVVVYAREGGLTVADRARIAEDATQLRK